MKALLGLLDLFRLFSLQMPRFLPFLRPCLAFENKFLCFALPCLVFNRFNGFSLFLPSICPLCRSFFSLKRAVLYIEKAILFHVKHFTRFKRGISRFLRKQKGALRTCKRKKREKGVLFHVKPFSCPFAAYKIPFKVVGAIADTVCMQAIGAKRSLCKG